MTYSSLVSTSRKRVPSGYRDQSEAALNTCRPERYVPTALWAPLPPSCCVYAVVRTFGMRCPLLAVAVGFDCVAQPTRKHPKAPANARLRLLDIGVRPSIAAEVAEGKRF